MMSTKEKVLKILLVVVVLVGLSSAPLLMVGGQKANVSSFWGPDNVNETVLAAQTKLKELDLYDGNLSGLFGLRTRFAIYQFQESFGLSQTGILDIPTQQALFSVVPEPEYILVDYTKEGNIFLSEWIRYNYNQEGKPIELRGEFSLGNEDAFYQDYSQSTRFILTTDDGEQYSILNISSNDLSTFVGQRVSLFGLHLGYENNLGLRTVAINYVHEGDMNPSVFIGYTETGNNYLRRWVRKYYQELGEYVDMSGLLTLGTTSGQYEPNGHPTRVLLMVGGQQYSIENISLNDIEVFAGQNVHLRGLLLEHENNLGLPTIAINYVLTDYNSDTGALSTGI